MACRLRAKAPRERSHRRWTGTIIVLSNGQKSLRSGASVLDCFAAAWVENPAANRFAISRFPVRGSPIFPIDACVPTEATHAERTPPPTKHKNPYGDRRSDQLANARGQTDRGGRIHPGRQRARRPPGCAVSNGAWTVLYDHEFFFPARGELRRRQCWQAFGGILSNSLRVLHLQPAVLAGRLCACGLGFELFQNRGIESRPGRAWIK